MYEYIARVNKDGLTDQVTLVVYKDSENVHMEDGDEFVTIQTKIPL